MSNIQYYWSEQSRMEFLALFDDGHHSTSFKESVAVAIAKGWQGNRDKPFWAMALLVTTLSVHEESSLDGLDLITETPARLLERLKALPKEKKLQFSPMRIAVLRKVAEFFLAADSFANADRIMKIFAGLAQAGAQSGEVDPKIVREAGKELSQMAYHYRKQHFLDAHAASAFSIVKKFLAIRKNFVIDDGAIFDFWVWPESQSFQTYRKAFAACHDFDAGLQEAGIIDAMTKAASVDEPVIALSLASIDSVIGYSQEGEEMEEMVKKLAESDLKPFTKKELDFLRLTLECGIFGTLRSLASLRLLSFHPVQSAISNSLRTGQSKIPLAERVLCHEAASYQEILQRLQSLEEKIQGILKISLSLRQQGSSKDNITAQEKQLVAQGIVLLKKKRSKRWERSAEDLQDAFASLEQPLIELLGQLEYHIKNMSNALKRDSNNQVFITDKDKFSKEFTALYLDQS